MLSWILQTTILSLVLIFLLHNIYIYFKSNLTYPNVKDLINRPSKKYDEIFDIIKNSNNDKVSNIPDVNLNNNTTSSNMKEELKLFLNQQIKNVEPSSINQSIENYNTNNYSKF